MGRQHSVQPVRRVIAVLACAGACTAAFGEVHLALAAGRDRAQAVCYLDEDLTLMREGCTLPLPAGDTQFVFDWRGMVVDPTSVSIELPAEVELLTTTFPPDKPTRVAWTLRSPRADAFPVEISYFLAGLRWTPRYEVFCDPSGRAVKLVGSAQLTNKAGSDLTDLQLAVAVGNVRMVAAPRVVADQKLTDAVLADARTRETAPAAAKAVVPAGGADLGRKLFGGLAGPPQMPGTELVPQRAPNLPRTDLIAQHTYPVAGRHDLKRDWIRDVVWLSGEVGEVELLHRVMPQRFGELAHRMLVLEDDARTELAPGPLPAGEVEVLAIGPDGDLIPLYTGKLDHVLVGEPVELDLGPARDLVVDRRLVGYKTEELSFDGLQRVNGFDTLEHYQTTVGNPGQSPAICEVVEEIPGLWEIATRQRFERDKSRVIFRFTLEPGSSETLDYRLRRHHGERAKG